MGWINAGTSKGGVDDYFLSGEVACSDGAESCPDSTKSVSKYQRYFCCIPCFALGAQILPLFFFKKKGRTISNSSSYGNRVGALTLRGPHQTSFLTLRDMGLLPLKL